MAKKPGAGGIIVVAVVLGLITAYLIWSYLQKESKKNTGNWQPVVVAVADIKARTKITRDMIKLDRYPQELIAENSATRIEQVENKVSQKDINSKSLIRTTDLLGEGQMPTLAYKVPEGMRAIAVACDEVKAVGTSVQPGDRIDILASYQDPRTRQELTRMILQNVLVLAVNRGQTDPTGKEGANSSMTLAVKPEQTELIAAADRAGALRFSLRPVSDQHIVSSEGVTARDLSGGKGNEEPTPPPPTTQQPEAIKTPVFIMPPASSSRKTEMTVIRGTEERTVSP